LNYEYLFSFLQKKSALAKAPMATKPANTQTIPAKGKKANMDSSEESSDEDELPKVIKIELCIFILIFAEKIRTRQSSDGNQTCQRSDYSGKREESECGFI
jgi:di/tripeptidase